MSSFRQTLFSYFLPASCLACKAVFAFGQEAYFCTACETGLRPWSQTICRCCGGDLGNPELSASLCGDCLQDPPAFEWARSVYRLTPALREILHSFKYSGNETALPWMLDGMEAFLRENFPGQRFDFVMPVPLQTWRLLRRGYNQSLLLAEGLARRRGESLSRGHLLKVKATSAQSSLNREERRKQLKGAFALKKGGDLKGKNVLLIDDVYTTGSTLGECARLLQRVGAKAHAFSFARTPREFEREKS